MANLGIYDERAINRIKYYRILKTTLLGSLLHHLDDMLWICAALCNLKLKLICSKKEESKSNV